MAWIHRLILLTMLALSAGAVETQPLPPQYDYLANILTAADKVSAAQLTAAQANIVATINSLISDLSVSLRSDNQIKDQAVKLWTLGPDVLSVMGSPSGWQPKASADASTTAPLAANTYAAGVLTATANGALAAQDGITLTAGQTLLVQNEVTQANNGIYLVTQVGSVSTPYVLTRRGDANTAASLGYAFLYVTAGGADGGIEFICNVPPAQLVLGTTAITWQPFGRSFGPGVLPVLSGGTGSTTAAGARASLGISAAMDPVVTGATLATARAAMGPWGDALITATGSTTARTLQDRSAQVLNAKDYGAKGDGTTDDTASISTVLNAAASGGVVYFPKGNYKVSSSVTLSNIANISLIGDGPGISVITCASPGSFTNGIWAFSSGSNLAVRGITFNINNVSMGTLNPGLYIVGITGVDVRKCEFLHMLSFGVGCVSCTETRIADNYVQKDASSGAQNSGILISSASTQSDHIYILSNTVVNTGIQAQALNANISFNVITGSGYGTAVNTGEQGVGIGRYVVAYNVCANGTGLDSSGVYVAGIEFGGVGSTCIGNLCFNNAGAGIAGLARNSVISNNICWDNGQMLVAGHRAGISMGNGGLINYTARDCIVSGNRCYDSGGGSQQYGYFEEDAACVNNRIVGNNFTGNFTAAALLVSPTSTYSGDGPEAKQGWAGGTLTAGTSTVFTLSLAGAVVGDYVAISYDHDLQGCFCSGTVQAANVVKITIANLTGGSITIAAGTFRGQLIQHFE